MKRWFITTATDEVVTQFGRYDNGKGKLFLLQKKGGMAVLDVDSEQFFTAKSGKYVVVTGLFAGVTKDVEIIFKKI